MIRAWTTVACVAAHVVSNTAAAQTNDQIAPLIDDPQGLLELLVDMDDPAQCFETPEMRSVDLAAPEPGEPPARVEPRRVIIALDASGSMAGRAGGEQKMAAAKAAVADFLADLPDDVEAGLIAFGHHGDNSDAGRAMSCAGVDLLVAPSTDRSAVTAAMAPLNATGWTPLAAAIEAAGTAFDRSETEGEQAVFVVSDGVETCDGDPVAAARALVESDVRAIVSIIGFDLSAEDREALAAVSEAGRGTFTEADDRASLAEALARQRRESARFAANAREASNAIAANSRAAGNAIAAASRCIVNMIARESRSFGNARAAITRRDPDLVPSQAWAAVDDALSARHERMREVLESFRDDVTEARDRSRMEIERLMEEVAD